MQSGFLVAGTRSGCGKTTVTLGIMAALAGRGLRVQPFKCGPDFIDPTLHRRVTGTISRNLDVRMCGTDWVRRNFARFMAGCDVGVIEGVMGLFDGGEGSGARLARLLRLPVVLVVDVASAAESIAAVVRGFESLDTRLRTAGVILNRVGSRRHEQLIVQALERHCSTRVIGVLPRRRRLTIGSRHLGLHMGGEADFDAGEAAAWIREHVDLDFLLQASLLDGQGLSAREEPAGETTPCIRLALARDAAFCFYYEDNLDMLRRAGAEIVEFSPLEDRDLPVDADALYLGGGYPELYGARLSANREMLAAVRRFSRQGGPVYAECGGFMYLTRKIVDLEGRSHAMAGIYPVNAVMQPRLRRLGYRRARIRRSTLFGDDGACLHGHEFHYSAINEMPPEIDRVYRLDDGRSEGYQTGRTLGGYLHLHFGATPEAVSTFIEQCR